MPERPDHSSLNRIWARSLEETDATLMFHAPRYVRALRDITTHDLTGLDRTSRSEPATVIIPAGSIARAETISGNIQVNWDGRRHHFNYYNVTLDDIPPRDGQFLAFLATEDTVEQLLELGTWTCPDGLVVHIDREHGVWADWEGFEALLDARSANDSGPECP